MEETANTIVFDTRFIKCSCTNWPIAVKAKNQELIPNFQAVQKIWLGRKMYYKIHQLFMLNSATYLCKTSRTHADFYKLSFFFFFFFWGGGLGGVRYKSHNVFMIHAKFYKLFFKQKTFIQNIRKRLRHFIPKVLIIHTMILFEIRRIKLPGNLPQKKGGGVLYRIH